MPDLPMLYVCHGDEKGAPMHPCGNVQKKLREKNIAFDKQVAAKGNPIPFLRGSRDELKTATGSEKLPTMKLPDGTVLAGSKPILAWISEQS